MSGSTGEVSTAPQQQRDTLLLVDDDPTILSLYQGLLGKPMCKPDSPLHRLASLVDLPTSPNEESEHYRLLMAHSGEQAIELHAEALLRRECVPLAVVDMRMPPGIDGLLTAIRLRQQDPDIIIVIVTAYSDHSLSTIQQELQHDFIQISKPFKAEEFFQIIQNGVVSYHRYEQLRSRSLIHSSDDENSAETLLVVDDDPLTLQTVVAILRKLGDYRIETIQRGEEVMERVLDVDPDLILMDVVMGEVDGFEVCRQLKRVPHVRDIPVIFLTRRSDDEDVVTGFLVGGADYIAKPFSSEVIAARVKAHLASYLSLRKGEKRSRQRLLQVMSSLNKGVMITDRHGRIVETNRITERLLLQPRERILGQRLSSLFVDEGQSYSGIDFSPSQLEFLRQRLQLTLLQRPHYFEQLIEGAPLSLIQVGLDELRITALNTCAQQLLGLDRQRLIGEPLTKLFPDLKLSIGREGVRPGEEMVLRHGQMGVEDPLRILVGMLSLDPPVTLKGSVGQLLVLCRHPRDQLEWELIRMTSFGQLLDPADAGSERELRTADGDSPVLVHGGVFRDESHYVDGGVLTLTDLRDHKESESMHIYEAFQAGVAEMSSSILHNIGNSLQGVSAGVKQLRFQQQQIDRLIELLEQFNRTEMERVDEPGASARLYEMLQRIPTALRSILEDKNNPYSDMSSVNLVAEGVGHISEIIQLHRKGGMIDRQQTKNSLVQLIEQAVMLTGERLGEYNITLNRQIELQQSSYTFPRNQMLQAITTLLTNAIDAVGERFPDGNGGIVSIRSVLESEPESERSPQLLIEVSDNGVGVESEEHPRLFTFGHTTKRHGGGFGLHFTANFIRSLGGSIELVSAGVNRGATVRILFPVEG